MNKIDKPLTRIKKKEKKRKPYLSLEQDKDVHFIHFYSTQY